MAEEAEMWRTKEVEAAGSKVKVNGGGLGGRATGSRGKVAFKNRKSSEEPWKSGFQRE